MTSKFSEQEKAFALATASGKSVGRYPSNSNCDSSSDDRPTPDRARGEGGDAQPPMSEITKEEIDALLDIEKGDEEGDAVKPISQDEFDKMLK